MKAQDAVYTMTVEGMAALIEEHADQYGGADRLALLLHAIVEPEIWNALVNFLSADMVAALQGRDAP